jgi:hypothetical protein
LSGITEFRDLLKQRTWDKEVLLWFGPDKYLFEALTSTKHVTLDLLDLFDVDNLPIDEDETRAELRNQLRQKLKAIPKGPDNPTVLVVKSIGLLARYKVGAKEFYDWFIGSHTLVVLVLESLEKHSKWPEDVRCEAKCLLDYFADPTMVKQTYVAEG